MTYQIRHAVRVFGIGGLFALLGCGDLSGASLWAQGGAPQKHKVLVCHIPQGNMENAHEIWIAESAVPAHLDHGDLLGACPMVFPCTEEGIRDAIDEGGGPHYFDCVGPTIVPTGAEIVINNDVILDGEGDLIVDAGGGGGPGGAGLAAGEVAPKANGAHRVFSIPEGVTAEIIGFTVTGGSTPGDGGGILNEGAFTLSDSAVTGNAADVGGGVRNLDTGTLMVTDSDVSQNTAARFGGGIHNRGQTDVVDSVISSNEAGLGSAGLSNWPEIAIMTLTRTTVSGNISQGAGGGMSNRGTATLDQATISGNQAGSSAGGINNQGTLTMNQVTVSSNSAPDDGGGVWNGETGTLTVMSSTVAENTAMFGAGIRNFGQAEVIDTMVANNIAGQAGGGFSNRPGATMMIIGSTAASNTALTGGSGGIGNSGNITVTNTTISDNEAGDEGGGMINYAGGTAALNDATVSFNRSPGAGGGLLNRLDATMTVTRTTVQENSAVDEGGGIHNVGLLKLVNSTVIGNAADRGGGVRNREGAMLIVRDSDISRNTALRFGAGIHNLGGYAEVVNTVVSGNQAGDSGGGLANFPETATMTVTRSTVTGNVTATFGGGMTNTGNAELTETTISGNEAGLGGGGISNNGELVVRQSMLSSNSTPEDGGGIRNSDPGGITLMTTTVTGNTAGTWGGGIRNLGAMNIMDTTVSNNSAQGGTGISNRPGAWMALTNSTVSGNGGSGISNWSTLTLASVTISGNRIFNDGGWITARNTIVDSHCAATPLVDSLGGNIESPGNTCGFGHPADQVDVTPTELALGSLQDNGGPTWTHALLPGSFAIDSVVECVNPWGFPLFVDQRGASRPHGPACDAGSFELGGVLLPRDQCVNDADRNTYESLVYINSDGFLVTCISAAAEMATDCIFGSSQSSPPIVGCPAQAAAVIECYPSCPSETFEAFGDCVASCTTEVTGLSAECAGCYGELAECAAQFCLVECAGDPDSPECDLCRSQSLCNMIYDGCSGLPGSTDCGTGGTGGVAEIPLPMVVDDYFTGRSAFGGPPDGPPLHTEDDECPQRAGEQAGDCHRFTWDGTKEGQTGDFFTGTFWTDGYGFTDLNGLPVEAGATEVQFYAWSAGGGEQILFGAGISGSEPNLPWDGAEDRKTITLTGTPTMYSVLLVNLAGYTDVYGPFLWAANNVDNPGGFEFYVDDIQWVTAVRPDP